MLYGHLLLLGITIVASAFVSGTVAIAIVLAATGELEPYVLATAGIAIVLFFASAIPLGRMFTTHVPTMCPQCRSWSAYMLAAHPVSYRCSTCVTVTKTMLPGRRGTLDCPKCGGKSCFVETGSSIQTNFRKLLAYRCENCSHFDYSEEPPVPID